MGGIANGLDEKIENGPRLLCNETMLISRPERVTNLMSVRLFPFRDAYRVLTTWGSLLYIREEDAQQGCDQAL